MAQADPNLALLGASCRLHLGALRKIEHCSFTVGYDKGVYLLAGRALACARLGPLPQPRPATYAHGRDEAGEPH